jgi:hypothetical protein
MDAEAMCTYLTKRGSTYYFRRVIPAELRPALGGKAEFMLSLRTKDREAAKRLILDRTKETDRLLDEAGRRGEPAAPRRQRYGAPAVSEFEIEQSEMAARDEAERLARWEGREERRQRLLTAFERSTAEITPDEAAMRDLLRDVQSELTIERERAIMRRLERVAEREGIDVPPGDRVTSQAALGAPQETSQASGVMLDGKLLDLWAAERKPASKTIFHAPLRCSVAAGSGPNCWDQQPPQSPL